MSIGSLDGVGFNFRRNENAGDASSSGVNPNTVQPAAYLTDNNSGLTEMQKKVSVFC